MNLECGNVIIELYPEISPNAVERFKILIEKKMYDGEIINYYDFKIREKSNKIIFEEQANFYKYFYKHQSFGLLNNYYLQNYIFHLSKIHLKLSQEIF